MRDLVLTAFSREELQSLIIDSVNACLRANAKQDTRHTDPPGEAPAYVSKREAARLLSCSQSTIDNYARAGRLKRHYIGKAVRFDRVQVLGLAKAHTSTKQH